MPDSLQGRSKGVRPPKNSRDTYKRSAFVGSGYEKESRSDKRRNPAISSRASTRPPCLCGRPNPIPAPPNPVVPRSSTGSPPKRVLPDRAELCYPAHNGLLFHQRLQRNRPNRLPLQGKAGKSRLHRPVVRPNSNRILRHAKGVWRHSRNTADFSSGILTSININWISTIRG